MTHKMNMALAALALTMTATNADAKMRLPNVLSDGMVIQQLAEVNIWGWAEPGATVRVSTSWSDNKATAKAAADGQWSVRVSSPKASMTPLTIKATDTSDNTTATISNVLSGEVWVCAGQSNMEMPMRGFDCCPTEGYGEELIEAANPLQPKLIRYVKIPSKEAFEPQTDADCHWAVADGEGLSECSATGYFFAKTVTKALGIPVGLVLANKGGSRVESWFSRENLVKHTDEDLTKEGMEKKWEWDFHHPLTWGLGTFSPIEPMTVHGIIFYQGCSNVGSDNYAERLKILVEQWRGTFKNPQLPFYFTQIAPYHYDNVDGIAGARLREQQEKAMDIIPNSYVVATNDLVYDHEKVQIHPTQKRQVGERLAYAALARDYGMKSLWYKSPRYKSMEVKGDTVLVHLQDHGRTVSPLQEVTGVEIAGADRKFYPAKGGYDWATDAIRVTAPQVKKPVAVRYLFKNWGTGGNITVNGIPCLPFRSDNWNEE